MVLAMRICALFVFGAFSLLPGDGAVNNRDVSTESVFTLMFTDDAAFQRYTFSSVDDEYVTLKSSIGFTTDNTFVLSDSNVLSITSEVSEVNSLVRTLGDTGPLFEVNGFATLTLVNLRISSTSLRSGGAISVLSSSGLLVASGVLFTGCNSTGFGGTVYNRGRADFTDTEFSGAYANTSGAIFNTASGVVSAVGGSFVDCHSASDGGALSNVGVMTVEGASFSMNRAKDNGGDGANTAGSLTLRNCQFSDSYASSTNSIGGSLYVSGGITAVENSIITRPRSGTRGGGMGIVGGEVVISDLIIEDAYTEVESEGGGIYVDSAVLNATNLVVNSSAVSVGSLNTTQEKLLWGEYSATGRVKTREGAGMFVDSSVVHVWGLTCENLAASSGTCVSATACLLVVEGAKISRNYGATAVSGGTAMVTASAEAVVKFSNAIFEFNTLNDLNTGQKGGAVYALFAYLTLNSCTFRNHSVIGQGGSVFLESGSTLEATDLVVSGSKATTEGGFLYASTSSVSIDGLDATGCVCTATEDVQSSGGVIYATRMFFTIVRNANVYGNLAFSGGAIYVDQVKDCVTTVALPCTTARKALYKGFQVYDSLFEGNTVVKNAFNKHGNGGAIAGKQSIGLFNNVVFRDNVAPFGSALDLAPDTIFQVTRIETSVETDNDGVLMQSARVVLDNSSLVVNRGTAILLQQDVSETDDRSQVDGDQSGDPTYPILNRNSDLSGLTITDSSGFGFGQNAWTFMPCLDNNDAPEFWYPSTELSSFEDLGATYFPVCPDTAACTDSGAQLGIQCTCPEDSHYSNVINLEMSCDTAADTPNPTPFPTVTRVPRPTSENTTFVMGDQDLVLGAPLFDEYLPDEVFLSQIGFTVLVGILVLMTLGVNCSLHEGPAQEVLDDRVFYVMTKAPAFFHLLMCVNRKPYVDAVKELPDEKPEGAGGKKSMSKSGENLGKKGKRHRHTHHHKGHKKHDKKTGKEGDLFHDLADDVDYAGDGGTSPLLKKGALENMAYPTEAGGGGRLAGRLEESKEDTGKSSRSRKGAHEAML